MHQNYDNLEVAKTDATFADIEAMFIGQDDAVSDEVVFSNEQELLIQRVMDFIKSNPSDKRLKEFYRVISAKGGSGKTECVFEAIRRTRNASVRFYAMSYTNKAVAVMAERIAKMGLSGKIKCQTIHKTLCRIDGESDHVIAVNRIVKTKMAEAEEAFKPITEQQAIIEVSKEYDVYNQFNPYNSVGLLAEGIFKSGIDLGDLVFAGKDTLKFDDSVFIIDEASMLNDEMVKLFERCYTQSTNIKFIFLGDVRQLPAIGTNVQEAFFYKAVGGFDAPNTLAPLTYSFRSQGNDDIPAIADKSFEYHRDAKSQITTKDYADFLHANRVPVLNIQECFNRYVPLYLESLQTGENPPVIVTAHQAIKNVCNAIAKNCITDAPCRDYETMDSKGVYGKTNWNAFLSGLDFIITNNDVVYNGINIIPAESKIPANYIYKRKNPKKPMFHNFFVCVNSEGEFIPKPKNDRDIMTVAKYDAYSNMKGVSIKDKMRDYDGREILVRAPYWEAYPNIAHIDNLKSASDFYKDPKKLKAKSYTEFQGVIGHARTCYKMQGDEAPHIFVAVGSIGRWPGDKVEEVNIKNALHYYTAITRASKSVSFFDSRLLGLGLTNTDKKRDNLIRLMKIRSAK